MVAEDGVTSVTWESYPVLAFSQVPDIAVALMPGAGRSPSGVGEVATGATSAAVANAIAAATGIRPAGHAADDGSPAGRPR